MPKLIGVWSPSRGVWESEVADLLSERSEPFSAIWPRSGMTRAGVAFELPMLALPTPASESSSLPTPTARDSSASGGSNPSNVTLTDAVERTRLGTVENPRHLLGTPRTNAGKGPGNLARAQARRNLESQVVLMKTPNSALGTSGGGQHPELRKAGGHGPTLADQMEFEIAGDVTPGPSSGGSESSVA